MYRNSIMSQERMTNHPRVPPYHRDADVSERRGCTATATHGNYYYYFAFHVNRHPAALFYSATPTVFRLREIPYLLPVSSLSGLSQGPFLFFTSPSANYQTI